MRNIDVLLWEDNITARSISRVLDKYPDITLFTQNSLFDGFFPDLIILTHPDPYSGLNQRLDALIKYPGTPIMYIRDSLDIVALSALFLSGIEYLISGDSTGEEIHRCIVVAGNTAKDQWSQKQRTRFLNQKYATISGEKLSCRELAVVGGLVRAYKREKLAMLLGITLTDVNIMCYSSCKKLGIRTRDLHSVKFIKRFGSLESSVTTKKYNIKTVRKRPGYFVIPKLWYE